MKRNKSTAGFTLVELIVVIAVLGILGGIGTVGYSGYIKSANMGNDKTLVGNVMRALETSAYSYSNDFAVSGQYSEGLKMPAGFVVMSNEVLTGPNGETGYTLALSNDAESDPIGKALVAAFGTNYSDSMKLSYADWKVGAVGGSTLHNAAASMMSKIDSTADLMVALQSVIQLTEEQYDDAGDMIVSVAGNITGKTKTEFVQAWLGATNTSYSSVGFGYAGRENYSAIRMAYNNSFAEYVRANYTGDKNVDDIANQIANYGQSAGDLAYEVVIGKMGDSIAGKIAANAAMAAANRVAPDATFPYTANATAFNDPDYVGYGDDDIKALYDEWLAGPAQADAEMFYDIMVTSATDGAAYAEENGSDKFVDWFTEQANNYSDNLNSVQSIIDGKSAIVVIAYYENGLMDFEVYSSEADPRSGS